MAKRYAKKKSGNNGKKIIIVLVVLLVLAAVAGTAYFYYDKDVELPKIGVNGTLQNTAKTKEGTESRNKNPLTGLDVDAEYVKNRPYAIMINNIDLAQPLLGVSQADVMYECLVEGGITRILAVFQTPKDVAQIGSIRSARPDFINIAQGLDAIYFHIGGSSQAQQMLKNTSIDSFDLGNYTDMMWRDQQRMNNLGPEHSALTSGQKLIAGVLDDATRTKMKSSYTFKQEFSNDKSQVLAGVDAKNITATFSNYKNTNFLYDEDEKEYLVYQFGTPQMDANAGVQNSRKNVIILNVNSYQIDDEGHMGMDLVGHYGDGKYISMGKSIDIKWSKTSETEPIRYKTSDGQDLIMIPGQSYICTIPLDKSIDIK